MNLLSKKFSPEKVREFFSLLNNSLMSKEERKWWVTILPDMDMIQLNSLIDVLKEEHEEVEKLTISWTK